MPKLVVIWYNDQFKIALWIKTGNKYNQFIVVGERIGLRIIRQEKGEYMAIQEVPDMTPVITSYKRIGLAAGMSSKIHTILNEGKL